MDLDKIISTNEKASEIKAINQDTVHKICSGQVKLFNYKLICRKFIKKLAVFRLF